MTLYRVVSGYFVAGFIVRDSRVIEAAPILKRALMGRDEMVALEECVRRHWIVMPCA